VNTPLENARAIAIEPGAPVFTPGDFILILRADGTTSSMSIDIPPESMNKPVAEMTEEELEVMRRANDAFALYVAANSPQIMDLLRDIASDGDIIDASKLPLPQRPRFDA
jgi:hypothetical protein